MSATMLAARQYADARCLHVGERLADMVTVLLGRMSEVLSYKTTMINPSCPSVSVRTLAASMHANAHHNARGRKGIDHFPLILGGILIDFAIALSWNFRKQ